MSTIASIWNLLAIIASKPLGWMLPLLALFLIYLAFWALLTMAGAEDEKQLRTHPDVLEDELKRALDAAFHAAHPKYLNQFVETKHQRGGPQ